MATYKYTYRGIMVNNADTIVGIPAEEDKLIQFVLQFKRNSVRFYDLSTILSTLSGRNAMKALNKRLRQNGVFWIGAQRGSASSQLNSDADSTVNFNAGLASSEFLASCFNVLGQEQEFWHDAAHANFVPFSTYTSDSSDMYDYVLENRSKQFTKDSYISQIDDEVEGNTPALVAKGIVETNDRVLLTCYLKSSKLTTVGEPFRNVKPKLILLGNAAIKAKKKILVSILFNCKTNLVDGSGSYFHGGGSPAEAFGFISKDFNASNFSGKGGIILEGEDLYGYQQMKDLIV